MMEIRFEPRSGHLLVAVGGAFDLRQARAGLGEALRQAQARNLARILVDGRGITTPVSIADRYELATQLADFAAGRMHLAIVVAAENMFSKTLEDTARNRGVDLLTTDSMQAALEFLGVEGP